MSRSFARFDPKAADAKIWRTAENGKKYQLDDETGEILKGNVGQKPRGQPYQSRPLDSTAPDMARFDALVQKHGSNHKKAAREYFREKLQGRHIEAWTPAGPIEAVFTGGSWEELRKDMHRDTVKAALVPHLPDIIATGQYAQEPPGHDHPDVKQFHTYRKTMDTADGPKEVIVDVAERPAREPKNMVYGATREGTRPFADREGHTKKATDSAQVSFGPYPNHEEQNPSRSGKKIVPQEGIVNGRLIVRQKESALLPGPPGQNRGGQGAPTQDSIAAVDANISPRFEVVNLRMRPGAFGPFTGPFAGLNRIMVDGVTLR